MNISMADIGISGASNGGTCITLSVPLVAITVAIAADDANVSHADIQPGLLP